MSAEARPAGGEGAARGRPTTSGWGVWAHGVRPVADLVALARRAEERGAGAFLLADEGVDRDVYVTLAAIGIATRHLSLVPAITNPHSRHPVATAAALATLEEVGPGRVVAGLGTGGTLVFDPMGLAPARPYTALAEAVEVIDALLDGRTVTHDGEFTARSARIPWSPRRLPVAIAGRGPRVERLAGDRADWVILSGKFVDDVPGLAADLRSRPDGGPGIAWNPAVAWTPEHVRSLRSHLSYMTTNIPDAWRARLGVGDDVVADLRAALREVGPEGAADLVPQAVVDAFTITGTRAQVVDRLAEAVEKVRPDVVTFSLHEYTPEFVDDVAALAAEAGLAPAAGPAFGRTR